MKRRCCHWGLATLVIFVCGADDAPTRRQNSQSGIEPRSTPGAGQEYLKRFEGDWDVVKLLYLRPGEPIRMTGDCKQQMIHAGRYLQSEFVFQHEGGKMSGLGLVGFEAESGKFTSVWTDSRSTRMSFRQSKEPFNGEELVLLGRALEDDSKERFTSRTVTKLESDGSKIVHRAYATPSDGKERLFMELLMTRKNKIDAGK